MRSINPFEIWLFSLGGSQSCNALPIASPFSEVAND